MRSKEKVSEKKFYTVFELTQNLLNFTGKWPQSFYGQMTVIFFNSAPDQFFVSLIIDSYREFNELFEKKYDFKEKIFFRGVFGG